MPAALALNSDGFLKPQLKEIRNETNCSLTECWSSCSMPACAVWAQSSPSEKLSAPASSAPARSEVYHVYFGKAAAGKAVQLVEMLKTPNPKDPMPGHFILSAPQKAMRGLLLITHMGAKATVDATPFQVPAAMRDVSDWHNDTFVNGPSWEEFTKAMAISDDAKSKSRGSVYVVSVFRPRQDIVTIWRRYYQRHRIVQRHFCRNRTYAASRRCPVDFS